MRRIFQQEWFDIPFSSFTQDSSKWKIADAAFYEAFYQAFFRRYRSWEDLDSGWRDQKRSIARFIRERAGSAGSVLSLGCGLGWVERCLWEMSGGSLDLQVYEVAPAALRWIEAELPPERLHVGEFPGCLPELGFNLIYLVAVDYCLDQTALIDLLSKAAGILAPGGRMLAVSASFDEPLPVFFRCWSWLKQQAAGLLQMAGLHDRGWFWGWSRSREDYHDALVRGGYVGLSDGFIPAPGGSAPYWIEGKLP